MGKKQKQQKKKGREPSAVLGRDESMNEDKPGSDPKSYRWIRLENGLECFLVHDPAAAAAAEDGDSDSDGSEEEDEEGEGEASEEEDSGKGGRKGEKGGGGSGRAAAAMAVAAGHWDDPSSLPGLAHFCEHSEYNARRLTSRSIP